MRLDPLLRLIERLIPKPIYRFFQPTYHLLLAHLGALLYRHPGKELFVIGITGTKGKSSTAEIVNAICEEAGYATALASTIRFKINDESRPNLFKMTMPGRFFMQKFLREAVEKEATHVIVEMTSEGVKQHRHRFMYLDALIFTNIAPEHIESHGSFENYLAAKLQIAKELEASPKKKKYIVANADDAHGEDFLAVNVNNKCPFRLADAEPYNARREGIGMTLENRYVSSPLTGTFNISNILAGVTLARARGITLEKVELALQRLDTIPGRVEFIKAGQTFDVVVDYAHTVESLTALYEAFPERKKICVLGNTGGGRDKWKRPKMGAVADQYCDVIILTNEDPYDESPRKILDDMAKGIIQHEPKIILDRRAAIRRACKMATANDVVLISGKGTDPYIMEARGAKMPWSDKRVAEEELAKL